MTDEQKAGGNATYTPNRSDTIMDVVVEAHVLLSALTGFADDLAQIIVGLDSLIVFPARDSPPPGELYCLAIRIPANNIEGAAMAFFLPKKNLVEFLLELRKHGRYYRIKLVSRITAPDQAESSCLPGRPCGESLPTMLIRPKIEAIAMGGHPVGFGPSVKLWISHKPPR